MSDTSSRAPAFDETSFLGQWQVNIHSRPSAPHHRIHIESQGDDYRLRSDDGTINEALTLDRKGFNLTNDRMAVSLWRDGSRLFGIQQATAVWGAAQIQSRPDPRRPSPGPERPNWRFGNEWKVVYKTGDVEHPQPNTKIVVDPAVGDRHALRQVGSVVFDHLRQQDRNRTLDGEMLRSVASRIAGLPWVFAMVVVPRTVLDRLDVVSDEAERDRLLAEIGLLPFEARALVRMVNAEGEEEGVAVWGAEEG